MVDKRKRSEGEEGPAQKRMSKELVNPKRVQQLKGGEVGKGPVIYWCSRDQRAADNWALLYAAEQASRSGAPVAVAFNLVTEFLHAGARQFVFMLKGLRELEAKLAERNVKFFLLKGDPAETVPRLVEDTKAALLVTDFSPLRLGMQWRTKVAEAVSVPVHVVDAHNIVPVWEASDKREYGARTIRSKIHKKLPEFMKEYPELEGSPDWTAAMPEPVDWDALIKEKRRPSGVQRCPRSRGLNPGRTQRHGRSGTSCHLRGSGPTTRSATTPPSPARSQGCPPTSTLASSRRSVPPPSRPPSTAAPTARASSPSSRNPSSAASSRTTTATTTSSTTTSAPPTRGSSRRSRHTRVTSGTISTAATSSSGGRRTTSCGTRRRTSSCTWGRCMGS
uniref:Deoxyribodipyrimidine photo-lyase n=1 Tax=Tetraselmis sp. GSL018 TaxID=582737 RepID=A0A061QXU7_9CHLO